MLTKRLTVLLITLMIGFAPELAFCRAAGQISGKVTDAQTGDPLPGASVLIEGTSLGASTSLNGRYEIVNVPPGSYTIRVSYIGYRALETAVNVGDGEKLEQNFKLEAVAVKGRAVVITAQASGQNAAINEQLSSNKIMNAVSAARIQQLPDVNAAESVGRLPGVYVVRQGGEGTELVVRGLAPQYNQVMIDGVEMASTSSSDRSANLSMISSSSLSSIQLFKTATPDMDAAFLGGVVNFQLREAKQNPYGGPEIGLNAQGSYDNLQNSYNDYKFTASIGDRFMDKKLGIFVQGITQRINLTSDQFGGSYYMVTKNFGVPNPTALSNLTITYVPSDQQITDGTVVLDYRLPEGKIDFMNFLSRGLTKTENRSQAYDLSSNSIVYGASYSPNVRDVVTNLLEYQQDLSLFKVDLKLSHSYSDYRNTGGWNATFVQTAAGIGGIPSGEDPVLIAQAASIKTSAENMDLSSIGTNQSFNKSGDYTGSLDIERGFSLSDFVTGTLKFGGSYRQSNRYYDYNSGSGNMASGQSPDARAAVLRSFPWMTQPPYNISSNGQQYFPLTLYEDLGYSYGKFLGGDYSLGIPTNFPLLAQTIDIVVNYMKGQPYQIANAYTPDLYASGANDYSGNEYRSAGYAMATLNIGPQITFIPGVRYQGLKTVYTAGRYDFADQQNPYPRPLPHQDTTLTEYHGYWLPDIILNYRPFSWFSVRASYTNTLSYPSFGDIIPRIDVFRNGSPKSATWNNYALKPAHSQNYDLELSLYNNNVGLFSVDGFLKQIDNFIFSQSTVIDDPSFYPGLPNFTTGYQVNTDINDPFRVNLWGVEVDWQTHFWYLPSVLSGLVLNVNYTHIFSGAKYPYSYAKRQTVYPFGIVNVDTFYSDRLIDQPNDVVNLSIGYDYLGFSAIASMIYQANVYSGPNFWPELHSYKSNYLRWDVVIKQSLPWPGLEAYLDLNDLNGASDIYVVQGSGFPTSESAYGMTADLGLRWNL